MSERITWTKCPVCGACAAVGWETTAWVDNEPVEQVPVELDCTAGCSVDFEELRKTFDDCD